MAQENEPTAEEQLKSFQTEYREQLSSRYGLDAAVAVIAIPLGTVKQMEDHAKLLQQALKLTDKPVASADALSPSRNALTAVEALLDQKYKGPKGASK